MGNIKNYAQFSDDFKELYAQTSQELLKLEGLSETQLDMSSASHRYFQESVIDLTIDNNANHAQNEKSYGNYLSEMVKSNQKLIGYNDLYEILKTDHGQEKAQSIMTSLWDGDLYFHDSTSIQSPYCWAMSVEFLLRQGNFWGQLQSLPPKKRRSFIDQVKEVTIEVAQEVAGAVAIGDLIACYSYFVKKENLDLQNPAIRKSIEDDFQSLVHTLNKKLRPSHQSPFTNISIFDRPNLEILFQDYIFPDGSKPDYDTIQEIQKIFCDWFHKGDPVTDLPYRFPVVTLNLRVDDNGHVIDQESLDYFSQINLDKGCFNIYISSGNKIASCCRLTNDFDLAGIDSFGNGGLSLGSHRVVTINMARLGKRAQSYEHLVELLYEQLGKAESALVAHKKLLEKRKKVNFYPFMSRGIISMSRLFSTFGLNGIYECLEQLGSPITTEAGQKLAIELLARIKKYAADCSKKGYSLFNIEQVPAESLAVKLAAKDKIVYNMDYQVYANQFIPLTINCDIVERVKMDGAFSKALTGGGISHLNLGEKLTHKNQMKKLIEHAIKYGCEHFAINYNYCRCENNHTTIAGQVTNCPLCNAPIKDYLTRVIGYFTPVSAWSRERQIEHAERVFKKDAGLDETMQPAITPETVQTAQVPCEPDQKNNQASL
ncbi:MAG: anaerobic ribonucleoside-triphosphate reductase [bacterium]